MSKKKCKESGQLFGDQFPTRQGRPSARFSSLIGAAVSQIEHLYRVYLCRLKFKLLDTTLETLWLRSVVSLVIVKFESISALLRLSVVVCGDSQIITSFPKLGLFIQGTLWTLIPLQQSAKPALNRLQIVISHLTITRKVSADLENDDRRIRKLNWPTTERPPVVYFLQCYWSEF